MKYIEDRRALEELSRDAGILTIVPRKACVASNDEEVEEALRMAASEGMPVTARGGGTSIPSQAVGRGLVLLQEGKVAEVRPAGQVRCGPGLVKADLNDILAPKGLWMPVDPSSYSSCTIGGMVANNSSGVRTPKYGSVIDYVRGLRVIRPGGEREDLGPSRLDEARGPWNSIARLVLDNAKDIAAETPKVTKNSSGYRLERAVHGEVFDPSMLIVGSEGTLGVVTRADLTVVQVPKWKVLLIAETSLEGLDKMASEFRGQSPTALELIDKSVFRRVGKEREIAPYSRSEDDYMLFCEFDGSQGDPEAKVEELAETDIRGYDPVVLLDSSEVSDAWEVRNSTLRLAQDIREQGKVLVPGVEDLVVPPDKLGELVGLLLGEFDRLGLEFIAYGHAGDANLHARPMLDLTSPRERRVHEELMEECFSAVWKMGGSMTGEHGDGMLRAKFVSKQYPRTYPIMQEIRNILDPKGVLNPGVKIV